MSYENSVDYLLTLAKTGRDSQFEEKDRHMFIYGYCGIYVAALLAKNPNWVAVAVGSKYCQFDDGLDCSQYSQDICSCHLDHFYAKDGNGVYHDAFGQHDPSGSDELTQLGGLAHRFIDDETLRCVLESWYGEESSDQAAWALELSHD